MAKAAGREEVRGGREDNHLGCHFREAMVPAPVGPVGHEDGGRRAGGVEFDDEDVDEAPGKVAQVVLATPRAVGEAHGIHGRPQLCWGVFECAYQRPHG